jgi:hypothetical protein
MKHIFFLLSALVIISSCRFTTGSGNIVTDKRSVGNFSGISVSEGIEVEVKIGPVTEVTVEADDNIIKHIETRVKGSTLRIEIDDLHNLSDVHTKVYITTPDLNNIWASSSAEVKVLDVLAGKERLSFHASSSGDIKADIDAPEVEVEASSAGSINLRGKTRNYDAQASSGAEIKTFDLLSENTKVQVSSGASAMVHASISLNASASSGGSITYHGAAEATRSESSGGSISKRN